MTARRGVSRPGVLRWLVAMVVGGLVAVALPGSRALVPVEGGATWRAVEARLQQSGAVEGQPAGRLSGRAWSALGWSALGESCSTRHSTTKQIDAYTYDAVGNTAGNGTVTAQATTFEAMLWDVEGHLSATNSQPLTTANAFVYDTEGNRLIKSTSVPGADPQHEPTVTTTLYVGSTEYTVSTRGGTTLSKSAVRNYSVSDAPVATRTSAGLKVLVGDRNNTGQIATDGTSGNTVKQRTTPFGQPVQPGTGTWPTSRGYLNKTVDADLGTIHLGAREYDPKLGRFLSVDPVLDTADPQQMNGYAYSNNSPVTSADPSGLYVPCDGAACPGGSGTRYTPWNFSYMASYWANSFWFALTGSVPSPQKAQLPAAKNPLIPASSFRLSGTTNEIYPMDMAALKASPKISLIPHTKGQWAALAISVVGSVGGCAGTVMIGCGAAVAASSAAGSATAYAIDDEDPTFTGALKQAAIGAAFAVVTHGVTKGMGGGAANAGSKLLPKVDNVFQFPGAGRSGAGVKNFVGPPNAIARGASPGRVFVTDEQGRVIFDITRDRVKPVVPGRGFVSGDGRKLTPTSEQVGWIDELWGG